MLTQDRQAVSFFLIFAWRLRRIFKPKCSEVYYRQKKNHHKKKTKKNFCGKTKYSAFHAEVVIVRFENHCSPESYSQELMELKHQMCHC